MVSVLVIGTHSGGSLTQNLALMAACVLIALVVPHVATAVHQLRGPRRLAATVAMNVAWVLTLAYAAAPAAVRATAAIFIECYCFWGWESWCCYF